MTRSSWLCATPYAGWSARRTRTSRTVAAPLYLNLRKASIYGGSNEVQRQIIARGILGL